MPQLSTWLSSFGRRDAVALCTSLVLGIVAGVVFAPWAGYLGASLILPLLVICIGERHRYILSVVTVTVVQLSGLLVVWLSSRHSDGYRLLPFTWSDIGVLFLLWIVPVGLWTFISWLSYQDTVRRLQ